MNKAFNKQVLDTFCFYWPEMHSYVLVRVLEHTIALLPVRSRLALLYFQSNNMFKSWKHTLAIDHHTPSVTLSDVLAYEHNHQRGWIHAPCQVHHEQDKTTRVILSTEHTQLSLTARSLTEKRMFINLVHLKHHTTEQDEYLSTMPFHTLITHYQQHIDRKLDDINQLVSRMNQARQDMACYSYKLAELDHSIDLLKENTNPWSALDRVSSVKHQLTESMTEFHSGQARMSRLQERVSLHNLFLKGSRQRYEQIKARFRNHVWYPWFYSGKLERGSLVS